MITENFILKNNFDTILPLKTDQIPQEKFIEKVCVEFANCARNFTVKPSVFEKILTASMQCDIKNVDEEFNYLKLSSSENDIATIEILQNLSNDIVGLSKTQKFTEKHINYAIYLYNRELFDISEMRKISEMDTDSHYSGLAPDVSDSTFESYARCEAQKLKNYIALDKPLNEVSGKNGGNYGHFYMSPASHALFFIDNTVREQEHNFNTYTEMAVWLSEHIPELCLDQAKDLMRVTANLGKSTKEGGEGVYKYDLVIGGSRVRGDYKTKESPLDLALSVNSTYLNVEKVDSVSTNQNAKAAGLLKTEMSKKQEAYSGGEHYLRIHDAVVYPGFKTKNVALVQRGQDPFHSIAHRPKTSRAHGIAIPSGTITVNLVNKQIIHIRPNIVDFPPSNK